MKLYPKVLIICSFSQNTANGITINNLFKGWPKDRIAVADIMNPISDVYVINIEKYYMLGDKEISFIIPFKYFSKIRKTNVHNLKKRPRKKCKRDTIFCKPNIIKSFINTFKFYILNKTGISLINKKYRLSSEFNDWVKAFDPDIIYSVAGNIFQLKFLCELKIKFRKKLAIHIFDDYVNSLDGHTIFKSFWQKRLDKAFKNVLEIADINLAVSEKMAIEFKKKYGKEFYSFHNPIDPDIWLPNSTHNQDYNKPKRDITISKITKITKVKHCVKQKIVNNYDIVYAGKVNRDTVWPILRFIEATEEINKRGYSIRFTIYSPYPISEIYRVLGKKTLFYFKGKVNYYELPEIFRSANALLLPLDFKKATVKYIRLSLLTKATEYMISGTPIFIFAPSNIAVTEYLLAHKAAYHCGDPDKLVEAILDFINDDRRRQKIADNAFYFAKKYHLINQVGEKLRQLMISVC